MRKAIDLAVLYLMAAALPAAAAPERTAVGPSTATPSYVLPIDAAVSVTSLLTAGNAVGAKPDGAPWRMVGNPDGLGAFDNGDGTITVLMDHEVKRKDGVRRRHGLAGAFVSRLVIDKASLRVVSASDLIEQAFEYDAATVAYRPMQTAFGKLCSADLPARSALYDATSGLGYDGGIFLSGEELAPEGRPFAHIVTGPEAGQSYELPAIGNMSFENLLAHPGAGKKTVVAAMEDAPPRGEVYFFVGEKQASGDAVTRAGLAQGHLYGLKLADMPEEPESDPPLDADGAIAFSLADLGDVRASSGAEIETARKAAGVTSFQRPEDGAWDTQNHNRFYFNTTAAPDKPSRLWAVDFADATQPERGGRITPLLKGQEGQNMLDNMTVTANGQLILQEDPDIEHLARIYQFDPRSKSLTPLAELDPALFTKAASHPLSLDEESSGVIDVTPLLGGPKQRAFLLTVQPHNDLDAEIVQGGQLVLMRQEIR